MLTKERFINNIFINTKIDINQRIEKSDYLSFQIPKKNGVRIIHYLPIDSDLYNLQHKLLSNFLAQQCIPVCVKGFITGESYLSYLSPHVGSKYFLRIDIKDFFNSISENHIKKTFSDLIVLNSIKEKESLIFFLCDIVSLNNSLPQGACTSPAISNLVMARIDQRILKYCQLLSIKYTRYADDLLFSSISFNFSIKLWFLRKIKYILHSNKFRLNYSKLKISKNELSLNGFIVSEQNIHLSRKRLADIRHIISFINTNKHFIINQEYDVFLNLLNSETFIHRDLRAYPFKTLFQLNQYLCGYRSFLISWINPILKDSFQKRLIKLINKIENAILFLSC